ncbi:MAG: nitroreductase family deazaflavin-dependent oxidoreductase [Acidimicrobiia bacterium]
MPSLEDLARHRTIDLTTIGRRSGRPSRIEIWWFQVDGRFVITGTPGPRDWYANVLATPEVTVHVAGQDLPARAVPIHDPTARASVFDAPTTSWYSSQSQRQRLIDEAPMVEIVLI